MRILMLAPEPVYTPRGVPIAVVNRCRALTALGLQVDLVTYPMGQDVAMPGLRFVRTPGLPGLHQVKIGPSLAKLPLDALLLWTAARQLRRCRYDVIHTVEEAGVAGWLLHAIFRVPYVHDVHSDLVNVLGDYGFGLAQPADTAGALGGAAHPGRRQSCHRSVSRVGGGSNSEGTGQACDRDPQLAARPPTGSRPQQQAAR